METENNSNEIPTQSTLYGATVAEIAKEFQVTEVEALALIGKALRRFKRECQRRKLTLADVLPNKH